MKKFLNLKYNKLSNYFDKYKIVIFRNIEKIFIVNFCNVLNLKVHMFSLLKFS